MGNMFLHLFISIFLIIVFVNLDKEVSKLMGRSFWVCWSFSSLWGVVSWRVRRLWGWLCMGGILMVFLGFIDNVVDSWCLFLVLVQVVPFGYFFVCSIFFSLFWLIILFYLVSMFSFRTMLLFYRFDMFVVYCSWYKCPLHRLFHCQSVLVCLGRWLCNCLCEPGL